MGLMLLIIIINLFVSCPLTGVFLFNLFVMFLQDGKLKAVLGASGGANIIAGTTEVFLNHFALKMDPLSSVMAPRVYHQVLLMFIFS